MTRLFFVGGVVVLDVLVDFALGAERLGTEVAAVWLDALKNSG